MRADPENLGIPTMSHPPMRLLLSLVIAGLLSSPSLALAQATARDLRAVASDGTSLAVGEVTGTIEVGPSRDGHARFGRIRVRAGLDFEARSTAESAIPIFVVGALGALGEITAERLAWLDALHGRAGALRARIVLGDVLLSDVPVRRSDVRVEGRPPVAAWIDFAAGDALLEPTTSQLCARPGRSCVRWRTETRVPVRVLGERRGWVHLALSATGVRLEGWMRAPTLAEAGGVAGWGAGGRGPISDGCAYQGTLASIAAGTAVHLTPGGPRWATIGTGEFYFHDTHPDTPWVELTFATGVQRAWPGSTCSTGWVRRGAVTWPTEE